jgi:hypothetical protein
MLGSTHEQRSNAVGQHTSYLPDVDPGRQGGNTYTGNSTEPTLQDYENFFGPSARDIKTDLQRFKRHGRWHLPDILKGPNPWLTDRIDGLITDATNSPFTTKLLPYRYKDEVDGKIKWNVWNFDEGMASRVPYESAARTLTQSKRSFAGYMVRQGMAIVLEHNFMMTPKGRENFKNQLNQLIGSIQYTNDLDVHMALILAPSYQKTMRERYYSLDKAPSQICREFVDLFGMMQKNVNALDILIEEGKAILRTWGGPMPDFLLCNSKLTFQMTMTPEKTNYITQGADGVKRLRQGPDLASYRGLSVIHSRAFAMETGQHPRDILRRRVRTAEYYRILPSKKNLTREFEFYNEERDTWFTLSFLDLLKYARYHPSADHDGHEYGRDNPTQVDRVYQSLVNYAPPAPHHHAAAAVASPMLLSASLGARISQVGDPTDLENQLIVLTGNIRDAYRRPLSYYYIPGCCPIEGTPSEWVLFPFSSDLGIKHLPPHQNRVWDAVQRLALAHPVPNQVLAERCKNVLGINGRLTPGMTLDLYRSLANTPLNHPFKLGTVAEPNTADWFQSYAFYLELYRRGSIPMDFFQQEPNPVAPAATFNTVAVDTFLRGLEIREPLPPPEMVNLQNQFLGPSGNIGSVNHFIHNKFQYGARDVNAGEFASSKIILTYELLGLLLREYMFDGKVVTGIDYIQYHLPTGLSIDRGFQDLMGQIINSTALPSSLLDSTISLTKLLVSILQIVLSKAPPMDPSTPNARYLAQSGIHTIPMYLTTRSHLLHPEGLLDDATRNALKESLGSTYGHMSLTAIEFLHGIRIPALQRYHHWFYPQLSPAVRLQNTDLRPFLVDLMKSFRTRIFEDAFKKFSELVGYAPGLQTYAELLPCAREELEYLATLDATLGARAPTDCLHEMTSANLQAITIDLDKIFTAPPPAVTVAPGATNTKGDLEQLEDVEIVVIRPNIEHNMLGIIMGLGGDALGNTLWGQTELSVYDDSMHGIWGMSYKYHERAIVFNEKNLIRLWDIAYDGYNGGKDDTYVDWTRPDTDNGYETFKKLTLDVSKNYRGPSMMVMAFVHDRQAKSEVDGQSLYDKHFRRNWPSPIVFHDSYEPDRANNDAGAETLPLDYDNLQVIDVKDFRVFNNDLYHSSYKHYKGLMPSFHEMHTMRKGAGQASADAETHTDSLAFQGSMRIKEAGGIIAQEIQGSGHHGPDYTGVASVRAGKGQKVAGQAPTLHRLI